MILTGQNIIGFTRSAEGNGYFNAFAPAQGVSLDGNFTTATPEEFERALTLAKQAFPIYRQINQEEKAVFLDCIAEEIMSIGDLLLERCSAETGLPIARINGERARTCGQLKLFAQLVRDGWYVDARIDRADPGRQPLPKPDIRRMLVPLGPVAVFGASNFPLAFSTAGGDTASALAAGCPVIVKAHSSHPGTNELVSQAIIKAAQKTGMPEGVFSSLYLSREDAVSLVKHPVINAVGFTGSRNVGMLLYFAAINRPTPIPVYAEMSAVNPVILFQGALTSNKEKMAADLANSVNLGAGQFCTNPGLVLVLDTTVTRDFLAAYAMEIQMAVPQVMLNKSICKAYTEGISSLQENTMLNKLAESAIESEGYRARPTVYTISGSDFKSNPKFAEEIFGPYNLIVVCKDDEELLSVLNSLEGQLTATIHASESDEAAVKPVLESITQKSGRIIYGGYPTGVEVCHAMQHGGPFPSTSDGRATSVGTAAIYRFLRPVAFQDVPDQLLPVQLKRANPNHILRLLDGKWVYDQG